MKWQVNTGEINKTNLRLVPFGSSEPIQIAFKHKQSSLTLFDLKGTELLVVPFEDK